MPAEATVTIVTRLKVDVDDRTRAALIALGWTPPPELEAASQTSSRICQPGTSSRSWPPETPCGACGRPANQTNERNWPRCEACLAQEQAGKAWDGEKWYIPTRP